MRLPKIQRGRQSKTRLQTIIKMDPCTTNLEGNQRETSIQISEMESVTKQDPIEGGNHDETGSRRETQGDVHGNKPRNHEGNGMTKREAKGDTRGEKPGMVMKLDAAEGRHAWREAWKVWGNWIQ